MGRHTGFKTRRSKEHQSSTLWWATKFQCAAGGTADTLALEASARKGVGVQIPRGAPIYVALSFSGRNHGSQPCSKSSILFRATNL